MNEIECKSETRQYSHEYGNDPMDYVRCTYAAFIFYYYYYQRGIEGVLPLAHTQKAPHCLRPLSHTTFE